MKYRTTFETDRDIIDIHVLVAEQLGVAQMHLLLFSRRPWVYVNDRKKTWPDQVKCEFLSILPI
jgi:hypothetical protein